MDRFDEMSVMKCSEIYIAGVIMEERGDRNDCDLVLGFKVVYPTQGDNRILHRKNRGLFFSQMPISGGIWG